MCVLVLISVTDNKNNLRKHWESHRQLHKPERYSSGLIPQHPCIYPLPSSLKLLTLSSPYRTGFFNHVFPSISNALSPTSSHYWRYWFFKIPLKRLSFPWTSTQHHLPDCQCDLRILLLYSHTIPCIALAKHTLNCMVIPNFTCTYFSADRMLIQCSQ